MSAAATLPQDSAQDPLPRFFDQLSAARESVLLLDYDGTIAPFSVRRDRAYPYPSVPDLLDCIMSTCRTRVLLISGRPAREIPPLLGLHPHPEIWGSWGVEQLRADGQYIEGQVSPEIERALAEAEARLQKEGLAALLEKKPGAVAIHWRGLNLVEADEAKAAANRVLAPLALRSRVQLSEFDGGLELRHPRSGKGEVVKSVLSQHGAEVPIAYLGDDAGDEDAFRALGGRGLTVLVRPTYRVTAAQRWIRPPAELIQFLADWIRACGGDV